MQMEESRWSYKNTRNRLQTEHKLLLLITFNNNNNNNNNVKKFSVNIFLTRWSLRPKRWGQNWQRKSLLPVWTTRCLRTSLRVKKRRSQWSHRNLRSAGLFTVLDPVCTWIHKLQNYMLITFSALDIHITTASNMTVLHPWARKIDYSWQCAAQTIKCWLNPPPGTYTVMVVM